MQHVQHVTARKMRLTANSWPLLPSMTGKTRQKNVPLSVAIFCNVRAVRSGKPAPNRSNAHTLLSLHRHLTPTPISQRSLTSVSTNQSTAEKFKTADGIKQSPTNQNVSSRRSTNQQLACQQPSRYRSTVVLESKIENGRKCPNFDLNFDDFRTAFSKKTNWELIRALSVLWMCSFDTLADNALKVMTTSQRLLGQQLSDWLLKRTAYGQFVAGETKEEIEATVERLRAVNIGPLLSAPMEDDGFHILLDADRFDYNLQTIVNSVAMAQDLDPHFPMIQLRLTGLLPGNLCTFVSKRCPNPSQTPHVVEAVASALLGHPLDYEKIFGKDFPADMKHQLELGIARAAKVCQEATLRRVMVLVDAEYTYLNPALNLIALAMMLVCNDPTHGPPLIFYTYQNYLKRTKEIMERDMQFVESQGVGFAVKMVRGAYMLREKQMAASEGHADPIQDSYDATSRAYDAAVTSVLKKIAAKPRNYRMIVASHNEQSTLSTVKGMQALDIDPGAGGVFFGQLMGMADHISCNLGMSGFLSRKSLPYGSVTDTLPYLSRRAYENKAIMAGTVRDRKLLRSELSCRLRLKTT